MAAEEPQQQKQEPLGSDSEGTDQGRAARPGVAGAMPDSRFPRKPGLGRLAAKRAEGPCLRLRRLPSPSQWKEPPPRPPAGRAVEEKAGRAPARNSSLSRAPGAGPRPLRPPAPAQPPPLWAPGSPAPGSPTPDLAVRPRPSPASSSPPPPERPEPERASNYAGLRSTKDWAGRWGCCGRPGVVSGRRCVPLRAAPFVSGRAPFPGFAAPCFLSRQSFLRPLKSWTSQNGPTLLFSPLS